MVARITQRAIAQTALRGLQGSLSRVQELQQQLSSGKKVSAPSDDPSATASAMTFRSRRAANEQYLRNVDQVSGRLNVTDNALTQLSDRLRGVRELMVASKNGGLSADSRVALGAQVNSIRDGVMSLYNTTYLDRPVFGGTAPGVSAVDPTTGAYVGNDAPITARISSDAVVRIDVAGTDIAADSVPALLSQIVTNVSGSGAAAQDFTDLDAALSKVLNALGDVGARESRIDTTRANVDSQRLDLTSQISAQEDVDLPETIMNLQAQQVGYQSALSAAAKITQTSLLDFLK